MLPTVPVEARSRRTGSFGGFARRHRWCLAALACTFSTAGETGAVEEYRVCLDVTADIRALGSEDLFEWEPAADRLSALGAAAWPVLLRALETEGPAVREGIVGVLTSASDADDPVRQGLGRVARADSEESVRVAAVQGLRKLAGEKSHEVVVAGLGDPSAKVRRAAITACGGICTSDAAVARLVELALADEPLSNAMQAQRILWSLTSEGRAAATVGKVRAGAAAALEEAAGQRDRRGRRTLLAALLLAELDDASRLDLLVEAAKPDQPAAIRAHAVHAIGRLGGTDHVPVLAELLKDPEVSVYAYDALRRMSERGLAAAEQPASTYVGQRPPKPLPRP